MSRSTSEPATPPYRLLNSRRHYGTPRHASHCGDTEPERLIPILSRRHATDDTDRLPHCRQTAATELLSPASRRLLMRSFSRQIRRQMIAITPLPAITDSQTIFTPQIDTPPPAARRHTELPLLLFLRFRHTRLPPDTLSAAAFACLAEGH